jgi:hypothetical protein
MFTRWLAVPVLIAGLGVPGWAQVPEEEPGRGVVRISLLNGDVSIRRGDSGDYIAAAVNAPLVVEDRILTGAGSRTELQFDWANMLRVSANAEVRLAELENKRYIVQVARGTVTWRVLREQDAYVEISTPSVSVRPVRKGTYRVTVHDDDGSSEITVRSGEAEIFTPTGSERLGDGKTMVARGTVSDPEFRTGPAIAQDDWDRWNQRRDRDLESSRSYNYISRDIYGAEDLDGHGRWVQAPSYGWVWCPTVAAGWAPYRYGRWTWLDWYGWSWLSYDPWGWAPYHYGRWFQQAPYGWVWYPGAIGVRHYWAPAHVAFFVFGGAGVGIGVGIGAGWGRVGWVPLAPYERFYPWWGSRYYGNRGYGNNRLTIVNNVNITNVYRNARIHNGATVIDGDGFRRGGAGGAFRGGEAEFRRASLAHGPVPLTPDRNSLRFTDREAAFRGNARATAGSQEPQRFFSNRRPAEVQRLSFDEQRRGMQQSAGRIGGDSPARGFRAAENAPSAGAIGGSNERTSERGWRRLGETPRAATPAGDRSTASEWRRFGSSRAAGTSPTGEPAASGRRSPDSGARSERGVDSEWRRFGSARTRVTSEAAGSDQSNAGRFGEPAAASGSGSSPTERRSRGEEGWQRFGSRLENPGAPTGAPGRGFEQSARPAAEAPRSAERMPRSEYRSAPDRGGRSFDGPRGGQSIRISPPIVRERSAPSAPAGAVRGGDYGGMRSGGGGGGRGGGGRSSGGGRGR